MFGILWTICIFSSLSVGIRVNTDKTKSFNSIFAILSVVKHSFNFKNLLNLVV